MAGEELSHPYTHKNSLFYLSFSLHVYSLAHPFTLSTPHPYCSPHHHLRSFLIFFLSFSFSFQVTSIDQDLQKRHAGLAAQRRRSESGGSFGTTGAGSLTTTMGLEHSPSAIEQAIGTVNELMGEGTTGAAYKDPKNNRRSFMMLKDTTVGIREETDGNDDDNNEFLQKYGVSVDTSFNTARKEGAISINVPSDDTPRGSNQSPSANTSMRHSQKTRTLEIIQAVGCTPRRISIHGLGGSIPYVDHSESEEHKEDMFTAHLTEKQIEQSLESNEDNEVSDKSKDPLAEDGGGGLAVVIEEGTITPPPDPAAILLAREEKTGRGGGGSGTRSDRPFDESISRSSFSENNGTPRGVNSSWKEGNYSPSGRNSSRQNSKPSTPRSSNKTRSSQDFRDEASGQMSEVKDALPDAILRARTRSFDLRAGGRLCILLLHTLLIYALVLHTPWHPG